ncbi:MAG TPA: SDR family NAD(P)-dependent oxidoreductase, partial [Mycobacterium sp.]|nr:SDR family NAD(P)-dependent oxidoreductase [Mycobacterium sp.]
MATLITGASAGLGAEYARRFAALGHDLVLVARRREALERLAAELRAAQGIDVTVIALDLATPSAGADLAAATEAAGITVDVLVNNAGFGSHGDLVDADPQRLAAEIQLNCSTLVDLTARYLPAMRRRGKGSIVNIASTAGF